LSASRIRVGPDIPRPHRRGPVEAQRWHAQLRRVDRIPRPHRRGPVEAREPWHQMLKSAPFRALTGAAPLKPFGPERHPVRGQHSAPSQARPR